MRPFTKYFLGGMIILSLTGGSCPSTQDLGDNGDNGDNGDETAIASESANIQTHAFVVTTDFMTGSYAVIDLTSREAETNIGSINGDASATTFGNRIYAINRFGQDNIQTIATTDYATVSQFSTGNGSNPQDIEFVSATDTYVSLLNETSLLHFDPTTGVPLGSIDLSSYADADGKPEATALHLMDGKLYVALQRLDQNAFFSPTDHSEIVVVDTATQTITKEIQTAATNPGTDFVYSTDLARLLIGEVGSFGVNDGGIEAIDPVTGTSDGLIISEEELGGDIIAFDILSAEKGYAIVAEGTDCDNDSGFCMTVRTKLVSFNPTAGKKLGDVFTTDSYNLVDVRFNSLGEAYVCDTTFTNPGIRIFDGATDAQLTTDPISTGLPPYKVVFFSK